MNKLTRPTRVTALQWTAAALILTGFFALTFLPAFSPAKPDTGLVETVKNIALIVVGWLFGASTRDTHTTPTPGEPVQPPKDPP